MTSGVPAVFLDRDGVLIEDTGYPHLEEHLRLIPGAPEAVRRLTALGYLCVVVTNQSGVARGLFSEEQMKAFNALLVRRLAANGAVIAGVYACPFHAEALDERYRHADQEGPGRVDPVFRDGAQDHARIGFAIGVIGVAVAFVQRLGVEGAGVDAGDHRPLRRQPAHQQGVEGLHLVFAEEAAGHARLVGHHDAQIAERGQTAHGLGRAGNQAQMLFEMGIAGILDQDAVAIEEDGGNAGCHDAPRIRRRAAWLQPVTGSDPRRFGAGAIDLVGSATFGGALIPRRLCPRARSETVPT